MEPVEQQETADPKSISVIGPSITITGNIEASGEAQLSDIQIEGKVTGDIRCSTVILTESSAVRGTIFADRVRVSGTVEGGVQAHDLAVEATANITGDVVYERIRIAAGGVVQGSLKWKGAEQSEGSRLKLVTSPDEQSSKAIWIE